MGVSVPFRGLFFLTMATEVHHIEFRSHGVSVPFRGLFNLTGTDLRSISYYGEGLFPSPYGDYLI